MTTPTSYGWFHLMFCVIVVAVTVLMCVFFRDCSERTFKRIALICWIIFVVLEVYKQLNYGFSYEDGVFTWDYQWYAFPYQLCSTPLYALPFVAFLPSGKLHEAIVVYMSVFSFFGGLAVFFYPEQVFISTIGINIQTMVHHGMQIVLAVFFTVHRRDRLSFRHYLPSIPVFVVFLLIAFIANVAVYHVFAAVGIDETFNMFYIGPYFECTLPILSTIYPLVPYPVFFILYSFGFVLISLILYYAQYGIIKLVRKKTND
ncbi:MAG: YwaF family protein [Clostridia bacterium]|nr:YwaF family protein [Clostridia bacterium]